MISTSCVSSYQQRREVNISVLYSKTIISSKYLPVKIISSVKMLCLGLSVPKFTLPHCKHRGRSIAVREKAIITVTEHILIYFGTRADSELERAIELSTRFENILLPV